MPAIQRVVGIADATMNVSASPVVTNENITVISNKNQLGAHHEKNAHACRKAQVLTLIKNEQSLSVQLMTYKESF